MDDDEETWLTPQLSARSIDTESKPIDLKEWFNQIPTSDRASTLSRKLQKYAQKRAARERLRAGSSLDSVEEVSMERSVSPQTLSAHPDMYDTNASLCSSPTTAWCIVDTPERFYHSESESFGTAINVDDNDCIDHRQAEIYPASSCFHSVIRAKDCYSDTSAVSNSPTSSLTSHIPLISSLLSTNSSPSPLFTSTPELVIHQLNISESDDEFFDASSDLPEDLERVGCSMKDETGISVVRNRAMTQSLAEVEEELPVGRLFIQTNMSRAAKHIRSNSVSPRSVYFKNTSVDQINLSNSPTKNQQIMRTKNSAEKVTLFHSNAQLTTTPLSVREGTVIGSRRTIGSSRNLSVTGDDNRSRAIRRSQLCTPITNSQSNFTFTERTAPIIVATIQDSSAVKTSFGSRPSLSHGDLNPDLKTVQDLARQQEEALREAVMQQQQLERKHSWQSEGMKQSSVHSSAASLVSSKSADISTLHKPHATSRIPGPSKSARKTGIPLPSKKIASFVTREHAHSQSTCDDECF